MFARRPFLQLVSDLFSRIFILLEDLAAGVFVHIMDVLPSALLSDGLLCASQWLYLIGCLAYLCLVMGIAPPFFPWLALQRRQISIESSTFHPRKETKDIQFIQSIITIPSIKT
jgi:hypothetical protein